MVQLELTESGARLKHMRAIKSILSVAGSRRAAVARQPVRMLSSEKNGEASTPLKDHIEYRNAKVNRVEEILDIDNDDELQPQWKALEHRISRRMHKKDGLSGRSKRNSSAWDAEHV